MSDRPSSSHHSLPSIFRNLGTRGGDRGGLKSAGGGDGSDLGSMSPLDGSLGPQNSLLDLMTEADRVNSLDLIGSQKLLRIKRGLWFIIRGQKISTIDGVADFFEQVKEEMQRQQIRDESSRAGGTASLVESMVSTLSSSSSALGLSLRGESMRAAAHEAVASVHGHGSGGSSSSSSRPGSSHHHGSSAAGALQSPLVVNASSSSSLPQSPLTANASGGGGGGGGGFNSSAFGAFNASFATSHTSSVGSNGSGGGGHVVRASPTIGGGGGGGDSGGGPGGHAPSSTAMNNSAETVVTASSSSSVSAEQLLKNQQQQQQQEEEEAEAARRRCAAYYAKVRTVFDFPLENEEQMERSRITSFIEEWSDTVSMLIVMSQLFVLLSTCVHVGFNIPVSAASLVCDKLFGDLVAIISIAYRCLAPFKEFGMWRFDKLERTRRYFTSGAMLVDVLGVFPLDLTGYGLGWHCALFRPDRCDVVAAQFQLNRVLQCRGMFTNFGSVAETLFLRRGLHPILGRVVEVLLFLLCMTHVVACTWSFLLSRGDKSGFVESGFPDNFENRTTEFQYFLVLDWSIKSLVGLSPSGTSFPNAALDQAFVIVITICGVAIFANVIATIKLYFDRDCPEKFQQQLVDETIDMVQYMHLKEDFRDECLAYFEHMFKARFHMHGMRDFEDDLAGGLNRKLRFIVGRDIVQHVPLLAPLQDNEPFIVSLMQRIEPMVLPPNTVIFKRDDPGSTMLVIVKGSVDVLSPADDTTIVAKLGPGKVVGEVALLMDSPRTATVVSCGDFINVMSLDRRQMSELIMLFPEIAPILMREMARRMHQLKEISDKKKKQQEESKMKKM